VLRRDILPNALLPLVVVFGVNLAFLIGGTVIVENVFSVPGLGSLLVSSVSSRDFPVVQALTLFFGVFVLAVNLLTDIVHLSVDPRLTLAAV
jgi:peptide/nickel transport system permease protein